MAAGSVRCRKTSSTGAGRSTSVVNGSVRNGARKHDLCVCIPSHEILAGLLELRAHLVKVLKQAILERQAEAAAAVLRATHLSRLN
jgi:hypothetical protein